jgi:hypothetical protein
MQLLLQCMSPFLALNGHAYCVPSCPLLRAQLPRRYVVGAAVIDPLRHFQRIVCYVAQRGPAGSTVC